MNPRLAISILVLLAVLSCCCLPAFANTGSMGDMVKLSDAEVQQKVKTEWRERFEAELSRSEAKLLPAEKEKEWEKYWAQVEARTKALAAEMAKGHQDGIVAGTVVDQTGAPVAGARIRGSIHRETAWGPLGQVLLRESNENISVKTDQAGKFVIKAKRALWVDVAAITAPGCQYYQELLPTTCFIVGYSELRDSPDGWEVAKLGPVTLPVWRMVGQPERLYLGEIRMQYWDIPSTGGFSLANVFKLLSQEQLQQKGIGADMLVDMRVNPADPDNRTAILQLRVPDGGGVALGKWMQFFAPADDQYAQNLELVVRQRDDPCIFLKARAGGYYAKIKFHILYDPKARSMGVRLNYYVNPHGSRNLQLGGDLMDEYALAEILEQQAAKQAAASKPPPAAPEPQ